MQDIKFLNQNLKHNPFGVQKRTKKKENLNRTQNFACEWATTSAILTHLKSKNSQKIGYLKISKRGPDTSSIRDPKKSKKREKSNQTKNVTMKWIQV